MSRTGVYFPFLVEAPEFASNVLDALRQPLESGHVVVSRSAQTARFPARFQLVLAANPCPCGQGGSVSDPCDCTPLMRRRYRDRISGPVRDRIDIHRTLVPPTRPALAQSLVGGRTTEELAPLVLAARERQRTRLAQTPWSLNTDVPGVDLRKHWPAAEAARSLIDTQLLSHRLSARSADRILRVAWTIADLREHDRPEADDVELALAMRRGTPLGSGLRELVTGSIA